MLVIEAIHQLFPWLRHLFADSVYNGPKLREALAKFGKWTIEIVKRAAEATGFQLLPRRWVVERTLAWLNRNRRLAKDFEASIASAKAWVYIASVQPSSGDWLDPYAMCLRYNELFRLDFRTLRARPIQAALASASSFAIGAAMPLFITALAPEAKLIIFVSGTSLLFLAFLGALAARAGGASVIPSIIRVTFWGALAMGITAGVGVLFGTVV